MLKSRVIKWAIKQIVKDASGSYGDMRYLEDVLENEWGEKMFIFSHRLVPIDKAKLAKANARAAEAAKNDPDAPMQASSPLINHQKQAHPIKHPSKTNDGG